MRPAINDAYVEFRSVAGRARPGFVFSARLTVELEGRGPREYTSPLGDRRFIVGGSAGQVAEQLSTYLRSGASHLVLYLGDLPVKTYIEDMRRLMGEVAPYISGG